MLNEETKRAIRVDIQEAIRFIRDEYCESAADLIERAPFVTDVDSPMPLETRKLERANCLAMAEHNCLVADVLNIAYRILEKG